MIEADEMTGPNRRQVLQAAGLGLTATALAACGSSTASSGPSTDTPAAGGVSTLGPSSEVPVGSAKIYPDAKVVVTQLKRGEFAAFSAVCPHRGCTVNEVTETINCPCHGSMFALADGAKVAGPAPSGLVPATVRDSGGNLVLG